MTPVSSFILTVSIPRVVRVAGREFTREDFYGWLWEELGSQGLQGVHEGTLLSEEAAQEGLETESWTVDSGEAPRERDWLGGKAMAEAELYFATRADAEIARGALARLKDLALGEVREQEAQDWDAQWKASFLANPGGVQIPPFWRILPPWVGEKGSPELVAAGVRPGDVILKINPGAGFGTGTHETTQLCLEAIGETSQRNSLNGQPVLDFGSGSGILSIGAALLGAQVHGVEIDPLAIDNALENAELNGVAGRVRYSRSLEELADSAGQTGPYPLVIANILKPVLLEFAPELVRRMPPSGALILSGLIEKDVADVAAKYSELLGGRKPVCKERGEWRALVWTG